MTLKKIISITLIVSNLFASVSYAEDVIFIVKDDKAPYTGYLFPTDKASQMKNKLMDCDLTTKTNESLLTSISLYKKNEEDYNKKIDLLSVQNDNLAKNLYEARQVSFWDRFGFFLLGVVGTTAAAYAVKKAIQ